MRILIAEDDDETADHLAQALRAVGHGVSRTDNGVQALLMAMNEVFDVLILDRMLPGMDGLQVVKMLRAGGVSTPALMLTAMSRIADRVEALENGADDYLIKPYAFSELHARLNLIARRASVARPEKALVVLDLELDLQRRVVRRGGKRLDLQPREITMLEVLMRNPHRFMTRAMLLEAVWELGFNPRTNIVETHISRLRAKLNAGFATDAIITQRGSGYMIRSE
ncbi:MULTISPECIES: response regulator transcription factor [Caulobacter]|jgi:two-component system, OmpR family, response regulator|uniref:response regulator transcription factor n=2 Tax=Caulobacteraceae TaxID=76892 RepID=UPI0007849967|nr:MULTISPECIES: response regulator transcription factor [Caulobacter]ATC24378.1 DNA-binding response regulator [Caulobacter vibrioides]MBQ1561719.1 response regulator transcription factor [Caulobacter sp.]MCK5909026.1 response regulator transcription factor [Caulobacter sp.]PIB97091.1 DNA-binding response regulator [Caulobacter sp. X]